MRDFKKNEKTHIQLAGIFCGILPLAQLKVWSNKKWRYWACGIISSTSVEISLFRISTKVVRSVPKVFESNATLSFFTLQFYIYFVHENMKNLFKSAYFTNLILYVYIYSFFRANLSAVIQEKSCQRSLNQKLPADYPHLLSTMIPRIKSLIYCEKVCQICWKFAKI